MDYYSVLGVAKSANQDDIKRAYRKLAMQHHPDKGGDEAKFKEINEAYSVLGDPAQRAQYDNPQPQVRFRAGDFNNDPFSDIMSQMFGGRRQQQRNPDITIAAKIDLVDSIVGKKLIAAYRLRSGREETANIDIPPGARHGDTIRFSGLGDDIIPGQRGNLFVKIHILAHPVWRREDDDLYAKQNVNALDLILGCSIIVNTVEGRQLELKIPKASRNGLTFSISDYGAPNVHTGRRGKIFLTIEAEIPKIDDEDMLNKIREIRDAIS
jgi:curved DNA-binding protein